MRVQARLDVRPLAEEVAGRIVARQDDERLKWSEDGSVSVLIGRVLPKESAVKQTLAGRRQRFRAALKERLAEECWEEVRLHVYKRLATQHEQVRVKGGDFEADVDEELAPLIEQLWKAEIATVLSGQENRPGIAWIVFSAVCDLASFLNIVAEYDSEQGSLYRRVSDSEDASWEYALYPLDLAINETETEEGFIEESHEGQSCFYFNASVRFPRTDLPILLDRMIRHNRWVENGSGNS